MDRPSDLDLVVEVVRELFPEIKTQTRIGGAEGHRVRLDASLSFTKARARVLAARDRLRRFAGGAGLDDVRDQWRTGRLDAVVRVRGGWAVGGFSVDRKDMDIVIEVFEASTPKEDARLPARPVVPEPLMFLFPL
ncbi:MAG: hypothetical protein GXP54_03660 [Deltaproteobacteria bacterium]|nr:hypothetical protein [Deltaproteobacteria bacterium]